MRNWMSVQHKKESFIVCYVPHARSLSVGFESQLESVRKFRFPFFGALFRKNFSVARAPNERMEFFESVMRRFCVHMFELNNRIE